MFLYGVILLYILIRVIRPFVPSVTLSDCCGKSGKTSPLIGVNLCIVNNNFQPPLSALSLPPQPVRAAVWQPALWIRVSLEPQINADERRYSSLLPFYTCAEHGL